MASPELCDQHSAHFNNKDFNTREQLWLFPILQYTPADKLNKLYSFMPHRKCKTQEFEDSFGTNHNPLAGFGDLYDDTLAMAWCAT